MKKIDKLILKSFIGPFVATFFIAMFVLVMQVLWQYMARIAGKGLSFFTVLELLSYQCVGLIPLALPLGLLISSVMVLGGMAEHYELSSLKSSGTSLLRTIRPLIIFGMLSAVASFVVNDYVKPAANLQFGSRMYDINQKKPTLTMDEGVFNDDFNNFVIRLGERDNNGRDIGDVMIYDHTRAATGSLGEITAKKGEMYAANQGRMLVMELNDGVQYSERRPTGKNRTSLPYVRTYFDKYTKVFDLSEFDMGMTDPELFNTNRSMLATWQLRIGVDSINDDILIRKQELGNRAAGYIKLLRKDSTVIRPGRQVADPDLEDYADRYGSQGERRDSGDAAGMIAQLARIDTLAATDSLTNYQQLEVEGPPEPITLPSNPVENLRRRERQLREAREHPLYVAGFDWQGIDHALKATSVDARNRAITRSRSAARTIVSQAASANRILPGIYENRVKYYYDIHTKYSMAVVCIIFIFIGAPMGAIVRKGGFGYPILVSVIFFVLFIMLTIFCRKLAESFIVTGSFAGWIPCIVLGPIGAYITSRAMKDAKLVNLDSFKEKIIKLYRKTFPDKKLT